MEMNLTAKFSDKVDERFRIKSLTEAFTGHNYDFSGARTVRVYSVDSVPVTDYTRNGANRFGAANELGDTVQELTLSQDKAFTFTVDNGNAADQLNVKHAAQRLRANWDEVCTPLIDKYRLSKWASGAGLGKVNAADLTSDTVMEAVFEAGTEMSNKLVPLTDRVLFIRHSLYVKAKLSSQLLSMEKLGTRALQNGVVGELDGMRVVPVPDSYLPQGVCFMIKVKGATADPMKLHTFRVHKNPPGLDGDLAECRFYFDAFVLGNKVNGIYVYAKSGMLNAPSIAVSGNSVTISGDAGASFKYTLDGTDPKSSHSAQVYDGASKPTVAAGTVVRAFAFADGALNSPVAEAVGE